ncbi:hypothetical protein DSY4646 [Desulfitobacterium hafniense Y51]|uniref:Uncharacterized protein n=1 Tax=Desulfitobacterium hafniense (strain Y51) TaxID=138119 RepID=Q24NF7_DESHY|nr:hypothetical protein DSY4646 [Desulfitobacterium hafniense Y51]
MQVQTVVPAVMVMLAVTVAVVVPDAADLVQGFGLFTVDFIQKALLHLLAILPLPCHLHLHSLVDQILLGSHDVGDVSQGVGVVRRGIQVDVDTAGLICNHSSLPKLANNLLYSFDVLIAADGTDQLHTVGVICRYNLTSFFLFCFYAAVAHDLPTAALAVQHRIFSVVAAIKIGGPLEIFRQHLCGTLTGQTRHFNLNAEALLLHVND